MNKWEDERTDGWTGALWNTLVEHKQTLDKAWESALLPQRAWGEAGESLQERTEQMAAGLTHTLTGAVQCVMTKRKCKENYPRVGQRIRASGRDDMLPGSYTHTHTPLNAAHAQPGRFQKCPGNRQEYQASTTHALGHMEDKGR